MEYLGGRKFLLTIICLIFAFTITVMSLLPPEQFLDFVKFILSAYIVGNVATNLTEVVKKSGEDDPVNESPPPTVT